MGGGGGGDGGRSREYRLGVTGQGLLFHLPCSGESPVNVASLLLQSRVLIGSFQVSLFRARIFKLFRSIKIDSKESIPPAYVAWWAGTTTPSLLGS